jgi:hypothetical protein
VIFRSDGALSNRIDSVMLEGIEHSNAMPVNGCTVEFQVIFDGDLYPVTPTSLDPWSWVLTVENFTTCSTINTIGIDILICNVEMILLWIS